MTFNELKFRIFSAGKVRLTREEGERLLNIEVYSSHVYVYDEFLTIEFEKSSGEYYLIIGNEEYVSINNLELELRLYLWNCEENIDDKEGAEWARNKLTT